MVFGEDEDEVKTLDFAKASLMKSSSDDTPMMRDSGGGGGGHSCFISGTMVLLSDGNTKPIEDMKKGDLVLSYNEVLGENQVCEVL